LATDSLKNQLNDIKNRLDDVEKALWILNNKKM
jgi:hypothetical protein